MTAPPRENGGVRLLHKIGVFHDSDGCLCCPQFEYESPGGHHKNGPLWAHLGFRKRPRGPGDPYLPGCRVACWWIYREGEVDPMPPAPQYVNGRRVKLVPTEPTYDAADILAIEPLIDEKPRRRGI